MKKNPKFAAWELMAVDFALKSLCKNLSHCGLKIMSDNTTAIAYLSNGGGTRSVQCNDIAKAIWSWCAQRDIWFIVSHIPGKENIVADYESRHFSENTEWKIHPNIFNHISEKLGHLDVDLFASRNNHQVLTYVSWGPDPFALFVNAFQIEWSQFQLCYIFPPFRLLNRVLQKILNERVKAIVISPDWPAQSWYPLLHKYATKVLYFKRKRHNLIQTELVKSQGKSIDDIPLCAYLLC